MTLDDLREAGFDVDTKNHALAILATDFQFLSKSCAIRYWLSVSLAES